MSKVSKNGIKEINTFIKKPLETAASILQSKNSFDKVQPMFELVFKKLAEIENKWEKLEDR